MAEASYPISSIVSVGENNSSAASWTSATALNTVALLVSNDYSYNTIVVTLNQTSTISGGVVTFEGSTDGVTFFSMQGFAPGTFAAVGPTFNLVASTYSTFSFNLTGIPYFQVRLSTVITGTATVTIGYAADSFINSIGTAVTGTVAATQSGTWNIGTVTAVTSITNALPAGTNVIGHVITDSGSTTVVTGTVAVTQSTSPWVVSLASTTITGTVAVTQSTTPWTIQGDSASGAAKAGNPVQIGGVFNTTQPTVTTGQTVEAQATARGALIVATGTDAFAVNATLSAETTKVIGTVNQGTSPWVVNTTQWASTALGTPQTFGTAPTGVVIGTSSDIYVAGTRARSNQTTTAAGVLDNNLVGIAGTTVVTAAAGVQKVGVVGNAGAAFDAASTQNVATPANMVLVGAEFNTTPTTISSGNSSPLQLDAAGNLKVNINAQSSSGASDVVGSTVALNALNTAATVTMAGEASVGMILLAGTLIGTIVPEVSTDGGTTWTGTYFFDPATVSFAPSIVFSASNTATIRSILVSGGVSNVRVRVSAFTSGTANCTLRATQGLQGVNFVSAIDGEKATYRAVSGLFFTLAATPTDVFVMSGSSTKTIRINKIFVQTIATSNAGFLNLQVIRRSAANTGGTATTVTPSKVDLNDANSTVATCQYYTANPTALGAQVAVLDQQKVLLPTSPNAFQPPQELDFGQLPGAKSVVLRGTSDLIAINFGGGALPSGGATVSITIQFTEE